MFTQAVPLADLVNIDDWLQTPDDIILTISGNDYHFMSVDKDDIGKVDSLKAGYFGRDGHGKGEYLYPHMFSVGDKKLIIDNGRNEISLLSGTDSLIYVRPSTPMTAYNQIKSIGNDCFGYTTMSSDGCAIKMAGILDMEEIGSIDIEKGDNSSEFVWDTNGSYAVVAYLYDDIVEIFDIRDLSEPKSVKRIKGFSIPDAKVYFSDIICADDGFYVLNLDKIDVEEMTGVSSLLKFNYEGELLDVYNMDIMAEKILIDKNHGKAYFLSPLDSDIHFTDWPL